MSTTWIAPVATGIAGAAAAAVAIYVNGPRRKRLNEDLAILRALNEIGIPSGQLRRLVEADVSSYIRKRKKWVAARARAARRAAFIAASLLGAALGVALNLATASPTASLFTTLILFSILGAAALLVLGYLWWDPNKTMRFYDDPSIAAAARERTANRWYRRCGRIVWG